MLRRVWAKTNTTDTWKTKVEEHIYSDGSLFYSFRDRYGRAFNLKSLREAQSIIRDYKMEDVTDEMYKGGWIRPDIYKEVVSQRYAE
jgi:oligoribonuclease NrnB/cAMP/cGMP phosphodiesterase (DHH superfamily)